MYSDRFLYDYAQGKMDALHREAEVERLYAAIKMAKSQETSWKPIPRIGEKILAVLQMFHFDGDLAGADKSP